MHIIDRRLNPGGKSFANRFSALAAGLGVTSLVQSSTATCLILASFAAKGLVATGAAPVVEPRSCSTPSPASA